MLLKNCQILSLSAAGLFAASLLAGCQTLPDTTAQAASIVQSVAGPAPVWSYGAPAYAESVTDGGRGGDIIRVTSLASEGPGTLREALSRSGARIIVFEVGGAIDLAGINLRITEPDVTIAGQTAPSPGITILKGGFVVSAHDVLIQHLRVRPGDLGEAKRSGRDIDAFTTQAAYNVVVDHCSLSWSTDENMSASGPRFTGDTPDEWRAGTSHNILFSNNISAEGLADSTHAKGEHSKGSLIHDNVSDIVIYRNLYASNFERSPLFKGGVHGAIVNNFIYNPGQRAVHYNLQGLEWGDVPPETGQMDLVSNVMRGGPSTEDGLPLMMFAGEGDLSLHMSGNIAWNRWGDDSPLLGRYTVSQADVTQTGRPHMDLSGLPIIDAKSVERTVLANVGARPWDRDAHDVRVLADSAEGRGKIIDSQSDVGGYPGFTSTRNAFDPDAWDLATMAPRSDAELDASAHAKGT